MWLAHALTLSRIPIAVVFWLTYGDWRWSLALVVLAALTDAVDGTVARWWRRRTGDTRPSIGDWLDPVADKAFIILVIGAIQAHDPVPWLVLGLIVARELVLIPLAALYRIVVHGRGHRFKADAFGKAATIAEFVAVAALIMRSSLIVPLALVAGALGLVAVVHYVVRASHSHEALANHGTS
jgi:cardiolipin synthase (CMP-forming)